MKTHKKMFFLISLAAAFLLNGCASMKFTQFYKYEEPVSGEKAKLRVIADSFAYGYPNSACADKTVPGFGHIIGGTGVTNFLTTKGYNGRSLNMPESNNLDEYRVNASKLFPHGDVPKDGGNRAEVYIAANKPFTVSADCGTAATFTPKPNKNYELISETVDEKRTGNLIRYKCFTALYDLDEHKMMRFEADNSCSKPAQKSQKDSSSKP
jgi:hypothetical protein